MQGAVVVAPHAPVVLPHEAHHVVLDAREQAGRQFLVVVATADGFSGFDVDAFNLFVFDVGLLQQLQAATVEPLDAVVHLQRDGGLSRAGGVGLNATREISGQVLVQLLHFRLVRSSRRRNRAFVS